MRLVVVIKAITRFDRGRCIMKERPASEGRGCDGRRLRCAALRMGFAPLRRRWV
jgi:hypothetical protein